MADLPLPSSSQADELRKSGRFQEAIPLYKQALRESVSAYCLHWLAFCQRKAGLTDDALKTARYGLKKFPEDKYIRAELAWLLYASELKPAASKGDFSSLVQAAEKAINLDSSNELLVNVVVLLVIKTGKKAPNPNWQTIARFASMVDPSKLSAESKQTDDRKRVMSDRESWFINASRAFYETGQIEKAIATAEEGLKSFPNEFFLLRTIAHSLHKKGEHQKAVQILRPIVSHPSSGWYVPAELAEMELVVGNFQEAFALLSRTLQTRNEDKLKVGYFQSMAEVLFHLERFQDALTFLAFSRSIREDEGWSIPGNLTLLAEKFRTSIPQYASLCESLPNTRQDLSRACQSILRGSVSSNTERFKGTVINVFPDRPYAFVKPEDGSENIIVFQKDLPDDCAYHGAKVEYSLASSFDKKKGRDSFKAVALKKVN